MIPLYTTAGVPLVYADDDCRALFSSTGQIVAWFEQELLYAPNGRYLGWAEHGWVYDRNGQPALFAENAQGGPARPNLSLSAGNATPRTRWAQLPVRWPKPQPRPARRRKVTSWSPVSGLAYFAQ
ncbi:4-fold beta flower protein [Hymenobacter mucosus]|uniref:4-fold beta flower domain-containing protein n=1 Tax=Hymenobacter mucosus TaxID=1411120 RepID=A0A238V577_9BACT|nr:hypothetical protein [Hymenobacter mucosus]SNR29615.1 hypothetical protein SAMN06269173_101167 [Hymenobacter mucosus]